MSYEASVIQLWNSERKTDLSTQTAAAIMGADQDTQKNHHRNEIKLDQPQVNIKKRKLHHGRLKSHI